MKMTTEELIEEMRPLSLELEYADEARESSATTTERVADDATQTEDAAEHHTKKELILGLHEQGTTDIAEVVRRVKARPSYVAQVLQHAGHLDGYFDLYTTTGREQNVYTRYFRSVLAFRNVEAARERAEDRQALQLLRAPRRPRGTASGDGLGADRQEPRALVRQARRVASFQRVAPPA